MKIVMLAAGAGGMYCGSCLRDNALAAAMMRAPGDHEVSLVPLYTPLKTDEPDVSAGGVFYGGVNVYLQQTSPLFRRTPRILDWLFDRRRLLAAAGKFTGSAAPAKLGKMTVSILAGAKGRQRKELRRLIDHLAGDAAPDVVVLPNAMFLAVAEPIRREIGAAVICELTGEDAFLDGMIEPHKTRARELIQAGAAHVDRFIATSEYYADRMAEYMAVDRERIDAILPGVSGNGLNPAAAEPDRPPTIAHLSRMCPEKGLDRLIDALILLRKRPAFEQVRVVAGGYLPRSGPDRQWFNKLQSRAADALRPDAFTYVGELDRDGKRDLLSNADILCVPAAHPEAKGMFVLEGWACGLPFVGFDHGAFGELLETASAAGERPGVLTPPDDAAALADALGELLTDNDRRKAMSRAGLRAIQTRFSAARMAADVLETIRIAAEPR